jgi:hypothetical protein
MVWGKLSLALRLRRLSLDWLFWGLYSRACSFSGVGSLPIQQVEKAGASDLRSVAALAAGSDLLVCFPTVLGSSLVDRKQLECVPVSITSKKQLYLAYRRPVATYRRTEALLAEPCSLESETRPQQCAMKQVNVGREPAIVKTHEYSGANRIGHPGAGLWQVYGGCAQCLSSSQTS